MELRVEVNDNDYECAKTTFKSYNEEDSIGRLLKAIVEGVQIEDEIVREYCNKCTKRNDARKDMMCRHCYMQPSMYEYNEDSEE